MERLTKFRLKLSFKKKKNTVLWNPEQENIETRQNKKTLSLA